VQLGELQNQLERFERRNVQIVALSVDETEASTNMIKRLGLGFAVGSDPEQAVVKAFGVQNPDTRELAIHAAYIVDDNGKIFYRKVSRRRPLSEELIDAIDSYRGDYPRTDEVVRPRTRVAVAYPENNFQALLGVIHLDERPPEVSEIGFNRVYSLIRSGRSDDATVAFKRLTLESPAADRRTLLDTAAWLTRVLFFQDKPEAIEAGRALQARLDRTRELESQLQTSTDADEQDAIRTTLAAARAGLEQARAVISNNAGAWKLRRAKTTLRSYREIALATLRTRAET